MTIQEIIDLLKKEGIGSKQLVIEKLDNLSYEELKSLERDIKARVALKKGGEDNE